MKNGVQTVDPRANWREVAKDKENRVLRDGPKDNRGITPIIYMLQSVTLWNNENV